MVETTTRCDAVVVQIIATRYDEHGRPVGEVISAATKVFRASTPDFWSAVDEAVARQETKR